MGARRDGRAVLAALGATASILFAACGGPGSPSVAGVAGVAGVGSTAGATGGGTGGGGGTTTTIHPGNFAFARCMRSHGVPNWPDPVTSGDKTSFFPPPSSGIDEHSPAVKAALKVCEKYIPGSTFTPSQSAQDEAKLLSYAKCMRAHGVSNFPDPSSRPGGGWGFDFGPQIDQTSPTYEAATRACKALEP
jgi:hypothetical protein